MPDCRRREWEASEPEGGALALLADDWLPSPVCWCGVLECGAPTKPANVYLTPDPADWLGMLLDRGVILSSRSRTDQ